MNESSPASRTFFVHMGLFMIVLAVLGFGPFIYGRMAAGGEMGGALALHGITFTAWLVLFTYQASLVRTRNIKRHMMLGKLSLGLAAAMFVFAAITTVDVFARGESSATPFSPEQFIMLPLMDISLFVGLYTAAMLNRKKPEVHKRLMLLVGIMMMDPATGRLGFTLGFPPIGMLIHLGLGIAMCIYDRRALGSVHAVSKLAVGLIIVRYAAFFSVGPTTGWASFTHWLLG
ncbi:MAG: hypothetical protein HWE25_02525 [Alphaproteobacteria bacterium]|nr:hypothetical protein [Alphaproteobacteria bacterium]